MEACTVIEMELVEENGLVVGVGDRQEVLIGIGVELTVRLVRLSEGLI